MGEGIRIPHDTPSYMCMSTDISSGSIPGVVLPGARVFVIDTGAWYIVKNDLSISPYTENVNETDLFTDYHGVSGSVVTSSIEISAGSPIYVTDAPISGSKIVVTDIFVSTTASAPFILYLLDESKANRLFTVPVVFRQAGTIQLTSEAKPLKCLTAGKRVQAYTSSGSQTFWLDMVYHSEL